MISIAAINVNKKGTSCVGAVSELAAAQNVDVMALSEVDVLPSAGPGYLKQWKQLGWQACLSEAEPRGSRVALVSAVPFRPVSLCRGEGRTRCAAGLFDVQGPEGENETILIVATYCQSGDEVASSLQAEDILQSSFGTRLRYFAVGDWNCEQTQNSIGQLIANGIARAADEFADGCVLPCTGPGRKRRIDYGVCHWQLPATSVRHYSCHASDHLVVQYQCDLQAPVDCRSAKCRMRAWICISQHGMNSPSMMHSAIAMLMRPGLSCVTMPRVLCATLLLTMRFLAAPSGSPAHLNLPKGLARGR